VSVRKVELFEPPFKMRWVVNCMVKMNPKFPVDACFLCCEATMIFVHDKIVWHGIFIVTPCILKIRRISHTNKCTNCSSISYINVKLFTIKHLNCSYII